MSQWNIQALRAKERKHIPVVLTKDEVQKVLINLTDIYQLIVYMMYGCGLRISEALNIRVKDIDFGFDRVYIWDSKSLKDRTVPLPQKIKEQLKVQVAKIEEIHKKDMADGYGTVYMPYALERKYPNAKFETKWQFLFPMKNVAKDPRIEIICQLGKGKGKVSRFYFLEGLKKLLIAQSVLQFKENNGISDELWAEMNAFAGIGE